LLFLVVSYLQREVKGIASAYHVLIRGDIFTWLDCKETERIMVKKAAQARPNRLLRAARKERGWTQQQVADRIGASLALNISRWESGTAFPSAYYIERLCQLFGKSVRELGLSQLADETQSEQAPPRVPVEQTASSSVPETRTEERAEQSLLASRSEQLTQGASRADLLAFRDDSLPLPLTPLVGREADVTAVCALLRGPEVRLVTLTGAGGIGKTRLALRVAAQLCADFADGVWFVSLAALDDPALVISTIAKTLGLKESEHRSPFDLVQSALRERRLLLLLDNFERLLPAALQLIALLARCPQLKILVTSRAVLHVQGEYEFPVFPLALPALEPIPATEVLASCPAVVLFVQRAQAVRPGFQVRDSNARAIAEICVRLDGLPLALELAAARSKVLSPQELLVRLTHRLEVLTSGPQDLPARQQTLRNTILWSYQLLDAQEQRLFRRLSVFAGSCTLEAAEVVCAALAGEEGTGYLLESVTSLLDKSLLRTIQQEGQETRLVMLETIREYGLEALSASRELEATCRAHALYYLRLAEEAESKLLGSQHASWVGRLAREHDNLRTALQWALDHEECRLALRMASALPVFWLIEGHVSEGHAFLERALANSEGAEAPVLAKAMAAFGWLAYAQSDFGQAEAWCQKSLALYRTLGETGGIALSLYRLGCVDMFRGDNARARLLLEEALARLREGDDIVGISDALRALGNVFIVQGEYARACTLLEESLTLNKKVDYSSGVADSLYLLASAVFYQGDLLRAHALLEESLALCRQVGYKRGIALVLVTQGLVALVQGERATARALLEEGLARARVGGWRHGIVWGVYGLGWVAFFEQDYGKAHLLFEEGLLLCREMGNKTFAAFYLEGLASTVAVQGQPAWAVQLWGAAEQLRQTIGVAVPPLTRLMYEHLVTNLQVRLGEEAFRVLSEQGRTMTLDQVLTVGESVGTSAPGRAESHQFHEH
jgi:predicted ATPase/transcriptional regulator with XRE-family HTH domain